MTPVIKWQKSPIGQELKDFGWQEKWGLKIEPDKYYFVFKIGVIYGQKRIIIEVTDYRQLKLPSDFSLTVIDGKIYGWLLNGEVYKSSNNGWRACKLWLDFVEKTKLDNFPAKHREFVANL